MTAAPRPVALALGGLVAMAAAVGVGRFVYTPILPFMLADLGLTEGEAGLIASANFFGYLAGALLAATPVLGGSRRAWLLGALVVGGVTTATVGLVSSLAAFMVLRFLGGVASAFGLVFASTLVLERLSRVGRSALSAVHFAGVGTGIVVSALLVSGLAFGGLDWRWQWLASGFLSLLAVGFVAWLVPGEADPPPAPRRPGQGKGMAALITAYGLFGFGYIITATFLVAIVRGSEAVRPLEPIIWLVVGLAAAPSVVLWTRVAGRVGVTRAFALAALVEAVGVAASVLWLTPTGIVIGAALLGGTFMGLTALGLIGARELGGGEPRRVLAAMTAAFGLGQIVGPSLAGLLYDQTGSFAPSSLAAAAALIVAAALAMTIKVRP